MFILKVDGFIKIFGEIESFDSLLSYLFIFKDTTSFSFFLSDISLFLLIGTIAFGFFYSPPSTFLLNCFFLFVAQTCIFVFTMDKSLEVVANVR